MAYIQNGIGYTLKCDKCGTLLHREGKDKPFLSLDINELDSIAKEYGWLINKRVHKCTCCRTFKTTTPAFSIPIIFNIIRSKFNC